jgi:mitochondrial intermediate peptidase
MDFVETPSHLLENFAYDSYFLRQWARHYRTGAVIPQKVVSQLARAREDFQAIERQNQILYATLDQELFGASEDDSSSASTTDVFAALHVKYNVPYAQGTHWQSRFGHLITYGATYYGYLYSQVFAREIWENCFEKKPASSGDKGSDTHAPRADKASTLSRSTGERLWHTVLQHGGAKDPGDMISEMLQRK